MMRQGAMRLLLIQALTGLSAFDGLLARGRVLVHEEPRGAVDVDLRDGHDRQVGQLISMVLAKLETHVRPIEAIATRTCAAKDRSTRSTRLLAQGAIRRLSDLRAPAGSVSAGSAFLPSLR